MVGHAYLCISYLVGGRIKDHMSSLAVLFDDAYWFTKVRNMLKNIIYSFEDLVSSDFPLLSRMHFRDPG